MRIALIWLTFLMPVPAAAQGRLDDVAVWLADLELIAEELPELHPDWFRHQTREEWRKGVDGLRMALPDLTSTGRVVGMMELVAQGGDGHTQLDWGKAGLRYCPLSVERLSDGLLIVAAGEQYPDLLGRQLIAIADQPIDDVLERLRPIVAHDNEHGFRRGALKLVPFPAILRVLGLGEESDALALTVQEANGAHRQHRVELAVADQGWAGVQRTTPLCEEDSGEAFWWRRLPEHRAVYFKYNKCRDPLRFMGVVAGLWKEIKDEDLDRFIIDMRHNGGGSSIQFGALLGRVGSSKRLNQRGKLFGIIGTRTYSSAMLNAIQLSQDTEAILVGSPTSGRPNHFGEIRYLKLPGTGFGVWHSTKSFVRVDGDPDSLVPDVDVGTSMADYLAGRDPVLEAVLEWSEEK